MYLPKHFEATEAQALELIAKEPFATVISVQDGAPFVSHLPLILAPEEAGKPRRLLGHMARANPQWQIWKDHPSVLAVFHGPHTYITPRWYASHDVPTWNYAVVHVRGKARLVESEAATARALVLMTEFFEGKGPDAWRYRLPDDLKGKGALTAAIAAFEIEVESLTAKFKLSQNRNDHDYAGVLKGLAQRDDEQSRGILSMMKR